MWQLSEAQTCSLPLAPMSTALVSGGLAAVERVIAETATVSSIIHLGTDESCKFPHTFVRNRSVR